MVVNFFTPSPVELYTIFNSKLKNCVVACSLDSNGDINCYLESGKSFSFYIEDFSEGMVEVLSCGKIIKIDENYYDVDEILRSPEKQEEDTRGLCFSHSTEDVN